MITLELANTVLLPFLAVGQRCEYLRCFFTTYASLKFCCRLLKSASIGYHWIVNTLAKVLNKILVILIPTRWPLCSVDEKPTTRLLPN